MSDDDLEAITEADDFDYDTLMAAAAELDERRDLDKDVRDRVGDAEPGTSAEQAAFRSVIPDDWSDWAANRKARSIEPTVAEQAQEQWMDYWLMMQRKASEDINGQFVKPGMSEALKRARLNEDNFFDGTARSRTRRFMSTDLIDWLDQNKMLTKTEWLSNFYDSYKKRLQRLGGPAALGENA